MQRWLVFAAIMALLCFLYPPLLGFCFSVAAFYALTFFFRQIISG